jgi:uncharacterized protein (DUF58 family)
MSTWPWIAALAVLAFLGGTVTGWSLLAHLAYALAGLDIAALGTVAAGRHGLRARSSVDRTCLTAGDTLLESCTLQKHSIWPAVWLQVEWSDGETSSLTLRGGASRTVGHERTFPHRGLYAAAGPHLIARDLLGLAAMAGASGPETPILVYPRPVPAPAALEAIRALAASRLRRPATELDATLGDLRDYVEGDAPSRIHWRTTARRGTLTVTDPECRQRRSLWLLVDMGGDEEAADEVAGIAAYLAVATARFQLGAIVAGETLTIVHPRGGHASPGRILATLAEMPNAPESQLPALVRSARQAADPGCFVVVSAAARPGGTDPARALRAAFRGVGVVLAGPERAAA